MERELEELVDQLTLYGALTVTQLRRGSQPLVTCVLRPRLHGLGRAHCLSGPSVRDCCERLLDSLESDFAQRSQRAVSELLATI